jgi:hypothetical protein
MHNQNTAGVDLDKLLNQAETTANLGSERHCRALLTEIAEEFNTRHARAALTQAAPEAPALIQALETGDDRESSRWFDIQPSEVAMYVEEGYKVRKLYEHAPAPAAQQAGAAVEEPCDICFAPFGKYGCTCRDTAATTASASCAHEFHHFGDQVSARRCLHCNKLEDTTTSASNIADQPTVAWMIEWKNAAGGERRMVSLHNFAADVRAEHGNATVTELVRRAPAPSIRQDGLPQAERMQPSRDADSLLDGLRRTESGAMIVDYHAEQAIRAAIAQQAAHVTPVTNSHASNAGEDTVFKVPAGFLLVGPGVIRGGDFKSFSEKANRAAERLGNVLDDERRAAIDASAEQEKKNAY